MPVPLTSGFEPYLLSGHIFAPVMGGVRESASLGLLHGWWWRFGVSSIIECLAGLVASAAPGRSTHMGEFLDGILPRQSRAQFNIRIAGIKSQISINMPELTDAQVPRFSPCDKHYHPTKQYSTKQSPSSRASGSAGLASWRWPWALSC